MSSVTPVPELAATSAGRLTARDAWLTVRRYGLVLLVRESFARFRYGDGFSHARALGLQLSITAVPLVIATIGLASATRTESMGLVLERTLLELTPGASDQVVQRAISPFADEVEGDVLALVLGLLTALLALTTAMGQLERGANRIYGILRDRPTTQKYRRALVMALVAGLPAMGGFAVLVASEAFAEAVQTVSGLDDDVVFWAARLVGTVLLLAAVTIMLRYAPARRQPGWSLLLLGGLVAMGLWTAVTAGLAAFLHFVADIGSVYGPLTGFIALLVWAQFSAAAILLGLAVSAQLEGARVGRSDGARDHVSGPRARSEEIAEARTAGPEVRERETA